MPNGKSLHIGLNSVDPNHYSGWSGPLTACEADAHDMLSIAEKSGFINHILLTGTATRQNVINEIEKSANTLEAGDIFMLSYSGHGGQLPDWNGDETDQQDETWCLYDGQLVDDEIYSLLGKFQEGVRILVFSDSCNSGTITKSAYYYGTNRPALMSWDQPSSTVYRAMPDDIALKVYQDNKDSYDKILKDLSLKKSKESISASVLLISGCQDNQLSNDGAFNGLFTGKLLRTWSGGNFIGNYKDFHKAILRGMPPDQSPSYYLVGTPNTAFENQVPFTI